MSQPLSLLQKKLDELQIQYVIKDSAIQTDLEAGALIVKYNSETDNYLSTDDYLSCKAFFNSSSEVTFCRVVWWENEKYHYTSFSVKEDTDLDSFLQIVNEKYIFGEKQRKKYIRKQNIDNLFS